MFFNASLDERKAIKRNLNAVLTSFLFAFIIYFAISFLLGGELFFSMKEWINSKGILDKSIKPYVVTILNAFTFAFTFGIVIFFFQRKRLKAIYKRQKEGELLRGIEVVEDIKDFNEKILAQAKKGAAKLEEGIYKSNIEKRKKKIKSKKNKGEKLTKEDKAKARKVKLTDFYTPRLYLSELNIPFYYDRETKQIIIIGSAGSGKTLAFFDYISKFIEWDIQNNANHCWIVYDRKWDFWPKLLRKNDKLFLPNDKKTLKWNWFDEFISITLVFKNSNGKIMKRVNYDSIRAAKLDYLKLINNSKYVIEIDKKVNNGSLKNLMLGFYPQPLDEASITWANKGRKGLEAAFITVALHENFPSPLDMINFINQFGTREEFVSRIVELGLAKKYRGINIEVAAGGEENATEAGTNGFENYYTIAEELNKPVYAYPAEDCDFSVREFVKGMKNSTNFDMRLVLAADPENETEYATTFSCILELLSKGIISLPSNLKRRITILLDEVASLNRCPALLNDLPEQARSRGANLVIGLQSLARFSEIYGDKKMDSILANVQNRIIMTIQDNFTLEWVKKNLDKNEYRIERESMGDSNNGSNYSESIEERDVLKNSELTSDLAAGEGYFKMGSYMIKTYFKPASMEDIAFFEENTELAETINVDFEKANKKIHYVRRKKVADTMIWLMKNTNQDINVKNISKKSGLVETKVKKIVEEFNEERTQVINACTQIQATNIDRSNEVLVHKVLEKITGLDLEDIKPFIPEGFIKPKEAKKASKAKEVKEEKVVAEEIEECPLSESEMEELNNYYDPKVTSMEDLLEDLMS